MSEESPVEARTESVLFEGHPAVLARASALIVTILTVGLAALVYWLQSRKIRYRITTQRVVVEHGLFSRRLEQIDLYRVVDYVVERPFGQRLMGTGNLLLKTSDRTTPEVRIAGVKTDVVALYERLREATETERQHRAVRVLDVE